jgi:hypothetical protein
MEQFTQKQTEKHAEKKVLKIFITGIVVEEELQVRNEVYDWKVQQYATAYSNEVHFPPVLVGQRGQGFILIDGFHRIAALKKTGAKVVEAVVTSEPESQWKWLAAKANLSHGLNLRSPEIHNAFTVYMESKQYQFKKGFKLKSYREIAADLGGYKRHTTIRHWMLKEYPEIAMMLGNKDICFGSKEKEEKKNMTIETIEKAEGALENALALAKTLDDAEARGRIIGKVEEILILMKEHGSWVLPEVNNDF